MNTYSGYIAQKQMERLEELTAPGKVIVVYGPRRVGKTTLIQHYIEKSTRDILYVTGEDIHVREYLGSQSIAKLKSFVGEKDILVVDEAQYVPEIGLNLKMLIDHASDLSIIATGSSSFDLAHQTGEPLTGRKFTLLQLPLAQLEICSYESRHETSAHLEERLLYGSYPELVLMSSNEHRELYLRELVGSYLFKDILQLEGIRHSDKLTRLLQLLAFQIGKEVSLAELAAQLGMSRNTVEKYIDLLEKAFVIYSRRGFSRNMRKEISKSHRYYFIDNGIRNTLINNFNNLGLRDDTGMLWENYICAERRKRNLYLGFNKREYFWRTYDQSEIDLLEEGGGKLAGYEIKWSPSTTKPPPSWRKNYPEASFDVINRDNYLDFIT